MTKLMSKSTPISIGGTVLDIPDPPGFAAVTSHMTALFRFQQEFSDPTVERLISYIPESEVSKALSDEIPDLGRVLSVQTPRAFIDLSISKSIFSFIKHSLKTENEGILREVEKRSPGLVESLSKGIPRQTDVELALSISDFLPLPPHEETDERLTYSVFVKVGPLDERGNPVSKAGVTTATAAYVKGKAIYLYSTAREGGLAWSREISRQWADSVVAANLADLRPSMKERSKVARTFGRTVGSAILGAFVGSLSWLVRRPSHRAKSS